MPAAATVSSNADSLAAVTVTICTAAEKAMLNRLIALMQVAIEGLEVLITTLVADQKGTFDYDLMLFSYS